MFDYLKGICDGNLMLIDPSYVIFWRSDLKLCEFSVFVWDDSPCLNNHSSDVAVSSVV